MELVHQKNSVLVADTQFLIIEALKNLFGNDQRFSLVHIVNNHFELELALMNVETHLLVIDYSLMGFDNLSALKKLMERFPKVSVLILTNTINKAELVELNKLGFKNIIYKTTERDEFLSAVDSALKGKKYYSSELLELMMDMNKERQNIDGAKTLTSSELEIIRLISQGMTTKEIAAQKHVSFHTVNTHRKNIFKKMGVSNASELVMNAIKLGWIDTIEYYI